MMRSMHFATLVLIGAVAAAACDRDSTAPPTGAPLFAQVAAGEDHACTLTTTGDAYCWGKGTDGELGTGSFASSAVPVRVVGGHRFVSISTGDDTSCGVTQGGQTLCWGENDRGQVGDGSTTNRNVPTVVAGGHSWSAVSVGDNHTCGITTAGVAMCWGGNDSGQLGNGSRANSSTPVVVAGGHAFTQISAGDDATCALTAAGQPYCWGYGDYGQLGHGSWNDSDVPTSVSGNLTLARIRQGGRFACGLTTAGQAYCWGSNEDGQLGAGSADVESNVPVAVGGVAFATLPGAFSLREDSVCGLTATNQAYCWGRNDRGQLGTGTAGSSANVPTAVSGGRTWQWIAAGDDFSCGVTTAGELYCWGSNADGKLGDGSTNDRNVPTRVTVPQG